MPKTDPLVSVIVPAYNAAWSLARTLATISAQTYEAMEIIVVDDGSTDQTADIAVAHSQRDPRVRLVRQPNRGLAMARNRGLEEARGAYVAPIDSDDLWHPENVEAQVSALEQAGPSRPFSFAYSYMVDEYDRVLSFQEPESPPRTDYRGFLHHNAIGNGSAAVFRREAILAQGGYDASLRARDAEGAEDWKLALQLTAIHPAIFVPRYLIGYRITERSMSANPARQTRAVLEVLSDVRRDLPRVPARYYWTGRTLALLWLLPRWLKTKDWHRILRYTFVAYAGNPLWFCDPSARHFIRHASTKAIRTILRRPLPESRKPIGDVVDILFGGRDIFGEMLGTAGHTRAVRGGSDEGKAAPESPRLPVQALLSDCAFDNKPLAG